MHQQDNVCRPLWSIVGQGMTKANKIGNYQIGDLVYWKYFVTKTEQYGYIVSVGERDARIRFFDGTSGDRIVAFYDKRLRKAGA